MVPSLAPVLGRRALPLQPQHTHGLGWGAAKRVPSPTAPMKHRPSGVLRPQAAAKLNPSMGRRGTRAREGRCPGQGHTRSGALSPARAAIGAAAKPPTLVPKKGRAAGGSPGLKPGVSGLPASGQVPREPLYSRSRQLEESPFLPLRPQPARPSRSLEVNSPELRLSVPAAGAGARPSPLQRPAGSSGHSPRQRRSSPRARAAGAPRLMSPRAGRLARRRRGRAQSTEHAPSPRGAQR